MQEELDYTVDEKLARKIGDDATAEPTRGRADITRAQMAPVASDLLTFEYGGDLKAYQSAPKYRAWLFAGLYGNADKCDVKIRGHCERMSTSESTCMQCGTCARYNCYSLVQC